jgi:hypothetical protein
MLAGKRLNQRNEGFAICRVMPRFWMGAEVAYNYIDPLPNNDAFWSANLFGHFQSVHQPRDVAEAECLDSFRTSFTTLEETIAIEKGTAGGHRRQSGENDYSACQFHRDRPQRQSP